jgi:hypothetical protein
LRICHSSVIFRLGAIIFSFGGRKGLALMNEANEIKLFKTILFCYESMSSYSLQFRSTPSLR